MIDRRIVLLEFNELCPSLMHRFMGMGELPAFQRFYNESFVYTTQAGERAPHLDPWIQWVTVHTGLNYDRHQILRLNEGHTCEAKRIWDIVSDRGGTSWICGSMSTRYEPALKGALIPDPWTTKVRPTPSSFEPFFRFVQKNVLDSTNDRAPMSRKDAIDFLRFMVTHGLSLQTAVAAVRQILSERSGHNRWKRAVILDQLQFDVFQHHWRRERPIFSTLFLNSTAHFQHLHWREMEPELFGVKPTEKELEEYRSAILFGYKQMDALLDRVVGMVDSKTTIVLATALSQQPCLVYEEQGGKAFYRPHDFARFLSAFGISGFTNVAPVMAHQFHVEFTSEDAAAHGAQRLRSLEVNGSAVMNVERNGAQIFAWCSITTDIPKTAVLKSGLANVAAQFYSLFYRVEGLKSGMHHPDGILWLRRSGHHHQVFEEKVDLDLVAPTLLAELGIDASPPMRQTLLPGYTAVAQPLATAV